MTNEFLNVLNTNAKPIVDTVREVNLLTLSAFEKAVNLNLASLKTQIDLLIGNLKAGIEIADPKAAQDYVAKQGDVVKSSYEKLAKDTEALVEIGKQYNAEVVKLVQDRTSTVVKKAA